jgi:hypothetical protein
MKLYLCEKPSQGKEISRFVGATQRGQGMNTGPNVAVTWCIGHLVEQMPPEHYVPELKTWSLDYLPVLPERWEVGVKAAVKAQVDFARAKLSHLSENNSLINCRNHMLSGSLLYFACQNMLMAISGSLTGWGEATSSNGPLLRSANLSGSVAIKSVL